MDRTKIFSLIIIPTIILAGIISLTIYFKTNSEFDEDRFYSKINRTFPSEDYLEIILEIEQINGSSSYFNDLSEYAKYNVENITELIQQEEEFLASYNPKDYSKSGGRYHKFEYNATLRTDFNRTDITLLMDEWLLAPTTYFVNNSSSSDYSAYSVFNTENNEYETWNYSDEFTRVLSYEEPLLLIHQSVVISDIFAPLAGEGTTFHRIILCDAFGIPQIFLTNEGPWWIS